MTDPTAMPAIGGSAPVDPMIGRIIDGRYRVTSLLAVGGMGRVYKAEQPSLGRIVAIKVLSVGAESQQHDPHFCERFAFEAATASRLTSPNTITIFNYGQTNDGIYYIVMEYVEGVTLGSLLRRGGRLSPVRAITIATQVCLSLREAHARGVIHRDIKPSNVILVNGDYDQVKVLDFGIAKQMSPEGDKLERELTSRGSYVGTPEYMAPESFEGLADGRSDIYSVGVMLYAALTGRLPYKARTAAQTILLALSGNVPAMETELGIPAALEDLVLACLDKDPDRRPQTVDDVMRSLQACRAAAEEAVNQRPPGAEPYITLTMGLESEGAETRLYDGASAHTLRSRTSTRKMTGMVAAASVLSIAVAVGWIVRLSSGSGSIRAAVAAEPSVATPAALPTVTPLTATPLTAATPANAEIAVRLPGVAAPSVAPPSVAPPSAPRRAAARAGRRPERDNPRTERRGDVAVPDGYKPSPY